MNLNTSEQVAEYCRQILTDRDAFAQHIVEFMGLRDANATLLGACKEWVNWMEANFELPSGNYEDPDMQNLVSQAKATIDKAELKEVGE